MSEWPVSDSGAVIAAALIDTIRRTGTPPPTDAQIAQALDEFSDSALLRYPEINLAGLAALRRWVLAHREEYRL